MSGIISLSIAIFSVSSCLLVCLPILLSISSEACWIGMDALPAYIAEKNVRLFTDHAIYTREEVDARYNIHVENYNATIEIEARTMIDMIRKDILPAVSSFGAALCKGLAERKQLGLPYKYEENNARNNCMLSD